MRVINVILIKNGAVHEIDSYGVFEEQLSQDVVDVAEKKFKEQVLKLAGTDEEVLSEEEFNESNGDIDTFIEDGIYQAEPDACVCLTWSEI
jgi:hypothetical protein